MSGLEGQGTVRGKFVEDLTGSTVGRFAVRARLGAGGMGEVYRAEDTKLKRVVALKRLAPHLRHDDQYRQRFLKEAERASLLNDSHIAAIHDIFEENRETFLVMEYVEGVTLRERLKQKISEREFLPVATQCAEALVAAHAKGIVHRDIKPENIMLTAAGQVKILDFGVAKRLPVLQEGASTVSLATPDGTLSGTPAYMAPEVLLDGDVDGRADIFSLGVVFYEILSGRNPFRADTFVATTDRILHTVPEPLNRLNPELNPKLERSVARMLAKSPADRYAGAREVLEDLRATGARERHLPTRWKKIAWAMGLVFILAALVVLSQSPGIRQRLQNSWTRRNLPAEKKVAVLGFSIVGGDEAAKAFGDGLIETLTAKMTQLTGQRPLQVVPASEIRSLNINSIEQARQRFGVNLVLEGSIHRAGSMVRVNLSLVDAATNRLVQAGTVTAASTDPFDVEDQVVASAVQMLDVEVQPGERSGLDSHGTQVASAFDLYLQGRGYLQGYDKLENIDKAIGSFQQALQLDSNFAMASAGLGEAFWKKYEVTNELPLVQEARAACDRAAALKTELAESHICLGTIQNGTGQYDNAAGEFERALALEPTRDDAYRGLAFASEKVGRPEEAEKTYQRAINLRPDYWAGYNWLGAFYYRHARYAEAVAMFTKVVKLVPESFYAYSNLCAAEAYLGSYAEAVSACQSSIAIHPTAAAYSNMATSYFYQRRFADSARTNLQALKLDERDYLAWGNLGDAYYWVPGERNRSVPAYQRAISVANERLQVNPRDAQAMGYLAWYHAALGEKELAFQQAKQALDLAPHDPELLFNVALVYNQFGDAQHTLDLLGQAAAAGFSLTTVRDTPNFEPLNGNPEFEKLLKKR